MGQEKRNRAANAGGLAPLGPELGERRGQHSPDILNLPFADAEVKELENGPDYGFGVHSFIWESILNALKNMPKNPPLGSSSTSYVIPTLIEVNGVNPLLLPLRS